MHHRQDFDDEFRDFDDSMLRLDTESEDAARSTFCERILQMIDACPDDACLYHKLGLCIYDKSMWTESDKATIETAFHRAILLDPSAVFSRMFLAHFYYDVGQYNLSLKANCAVAGACDPAGIDVPQWRLVKMEELALCCKVYLGDISTDELCLRIHSLKNAIEELPADVRVAARPSTIAAAVSDMRHQSVDQLKELYEWLSSESASS